ncbi:MAG: UDP-N-acetyl-D-mannosaminuronic acid transferase [Syntrophorhabdus sp. PtaB.Bin047]|nr:MAG: UDP-N-acetyl-D-mannosaminuronic acid transferase [Syntrophorhabdus sp. PtaB.Bin047]
MNTLQKTEVLGVSIHALSWHAVLASIADWVSKRESRVVCLCNVHSVVTAGRSAEFARAISEADIAAPDGAPIAWMITRLRHTRQPRINGPDLMLRYCREAKVRSEPIFLYGASESTLALLKAKLLQAHQGLKIAGAVSPPFRPLTPEEDSSIVEQINASGARVVFVGLGCPKQELWMAEHRTRIRAVMIGVGAAFDYHAGTLKRAPRLMQDLGLEWLHRLLSEPRRLWRRYLVTNTIFMSRAFGQLIGCRRSRDRSATPIWSSHRSTTLP